MQLSLGIDAREIVPPGYWVVTNDLKERLFNPPCPVISLAAERAREGADGQERLPFANHIFLAVVKFRRHHMVSVLGLVKAGSINCKIVQTPRGGLQAHVNGVVKKAWKSRVKPKAGGFAERDQHLIQRFDSRWQGAIGRVFAVMPVDMSGRQAARGHADTSNKTQRHSSRMQVL